MKTLQRMDDNKDGKAKPQAKRKSYYRTIAGKKYDRELLETAEKLAAYVADGKLTPDAAWQLLEDSKDSGRITAIEKATLAYVKKHYEWSKPPEWEAKPDADFSEPDSGSEARSADPARENSEKSRLEEARAIVNRHALYAAGSGLIPFPIVDLGAITGIQVKMVRDLAHHYDDTYLNNIGKNAIAAFIATMTTQGLVAPVSGVLKMIPGVGTLLGAASMSVSAGATTMALGAVFVQHYESGGSFLTFDAKAAREDYKNAMKSDS